MDVWQVTQYLAEVRASLHQLVRLAEAREEALYCMDVWQVTQYLAEVRASLHQLVRLSEAREEALVQLQILSDIRYTL